MEGKTRTEVAVESNPVTLTNGATIEARVVRSTMSYLRLILDADPRGSELIEDLHLIAQERSDEARPTSLEFLAGDVLVSSSQGELLPHVRALVLCAFRQSTDGISLVEPYQLTEANQAALAAADIEFRDMVRNNLGPGAGGSGSRTGR